MVFCIRSKSTGFPVDELTSAVADLTRSQACLISIFADTLSLLGVNFASSSTRSLYLQRRWMGCIRQYVLETTEKLGEGKITFMRRSLAHIDLFSSGWRLSMGRTDFERASIPWLRSIQLGID